MIKGLKATKKKFLLQLKNLKQKRRAKKKVFELYCARVTNTELYCANTPPS